MNKIITKEEVDINLLKNWEKNPRSIKKEDFQRLKNQIETLGVYVPLVVDEDYTVLSGNMRLRAFRDLGYEKVWVTMVHAPSDEEKTRYALSANDEAGYYEEQQLAELLQPLDINLDDYRVNLGKPISITELLAKFGPDPIEDEPPAVEEEAISKRGEIYQLGRHRVMCGDSTKIEDVEKLMNGQKADMVFTDPPYGVEYDGGMKKWEQIKNDGTSEFEQIINDAFANLTTVTKEGAAWYIWHASNTSGEFYKAIKNVGKKPSAQIVWIKNNMAGGFGDYRGKHEPCIYIHGQFYGGRDQHTVWQIDKEVNYKHPNQKPVELGIRAINNSSKADDIVLDLFGGSGSTLIACEQTNRTCYMMELDPRYIDVIRKRYAKFINKEEDWEATTPLINKD